MKKKLYKFKKKDLPVYLQKKTIKKLIDFIAFGHNFKVDNTKQIKNYIMFTYNIDINKVDPDLSLFTKWWKKHILVDYKVGDKVKVKDEKDDKWKEGIVTSLNPTEVIIKGWDESYRWDKMQN